MRTSPGNSQQERPGALKTLGDIPKEIRAGRIASLYLLFGAESYLLEGLLKEMLDALLPDKGGMRDFNLDVLDGAAVPVEELASLAATYPMVGPRRVLVVKNPAFLSSSSSPSPVESLRLAQEASEAGNLARALHLFFRALELEPMALDSSEVRTKIAAIRSEVVQDAPDLLPFLEDYGTRFEGVPLPESALGATDADRFLRWLEQGTPETTVLILVLAGRLERRTKLIQRIQEVGVLADVDCLKEQLPGGRDPVALFIEKRLREAKHQIDPEALQLLRARTRDELRAIVDELEKLLAYAGEREIIGLEDVRAVVSDGASSTVFDLTDALAARNAPKALKSLHSLIRQGEPPLKIHALLIRQVRLMLQAHLLQEEGHLRDFSPNMSYTAFTSTLYNRWPQEVVALLPDNPALNVFKQKPYPAYLILKQASNFTASELRRAYDLLLRADEEMKSSGLSESFILQTVVERLITGDGKRQTRPLRAGSARSL